MRQISRKIRQRGARGRASLGRNVRRLRKVRPSRRHARAALMATVPPAALMGGLIGAQAAVPAKGAVLSAPYLKRAKPVELQGVELPGPRSEAASEVVEASYYGKGFAGKPTASGETFNPSDLTAAHRTLPFGSIVKVTNASNGESVNVKINDRGPFHGDRAIDLSTAAARRIGMLDAGTAKVMLEVVKRG